MPFYAAARKIVSLIVSTPEILSNIKVRHYSGYRPQLPRNSAQQLVGAMAHPLNRPRL